MPLQAPELRTLGDGSALSWHSYGARRKSSFSQKLVQTVMPRMCLCLPATAVVGANTAAGMLA